MSSGSVLLVLLVLGCLQSFTEANNANGPDQCCFNFQLYKIPLRLIKEYNKTRTDCTKDGIIFTLNNGRYVCADPGVLWVKTHMIKIDQRFMAAAQPQPSH